MTVAVCFKCGAIKVGAFTKCPECTAKPSTEEEIMTSFMLTDHFQDTGELEKIGVMIAGGMQVQLDPETMNEFKNQFNLSEFVRGPLSQSEASNQTSSIQDEVHVAAEKQPDMAEPKPKDSDDSLSVEHNQTDSNERNLFLQLFLSDIEFARQYLSVHYPFSHEELEKYWDYLVKGDAYYSFYIRDHIRAYTPEIGLCFNKNIEWTESLRCCWDVGYYWNQYPGFEGLGSYYGDERDDLWKVEFYDRDILRCLLPLDISKENDSRLNCELDFNHYIYPGEYLEPDTSVFTKYDKLSFKEISDLIDSKWLIISNESIWQNTLRHIIDRDFMSEIMHQVIIEINKLYDDFGYDKDGYNIKGYDKNGFNRNGYDAKGFDENGYDITGYDVDGYNENGFHRSYVESLPL